jgi:hypothetical protein
MSLYRRKCDCCGRRFNSVNIEASICSTCEETRRTPRTGGVPKQCPICGRWRMVHWWQNPACPHHHPASPSAAALVAWYAHLDVCDVCTKSSRNFCDEGQHLRKMAAIDI